MDDQERLRTQAGGYAGGRMPWLCRHCGFLTRQPSGVYMEGQDVLEALLAPQFKGVHVPQAASP